MIIVTRVFDPIFSLFIIFLETTYKSSESTRSNSDLKLCQESGAKTRECPAAAPGHRRVPRPRSSADVTCDHTRV